MCLFLLGIKVRTIVTKTQVCSKQNTWRCLSPSVELLWRTPPFSPRRPECDTWWDWWSNWQCWCWRWRTLHSILILCYASRGYIEFWFYVCQPVFSCVPHLLSFSALQRTETASAGEAKVFQKIVLPDNSGNNVLKIEIVIMYILI